MKPILAILTLALTGCVAPENAGHYPRGFFFAGREHYLQPKVGLLLYGPNLPIGDPVSTDWAYSDGKNVHVSPQLAKKLNP